MHEWNRLRSINTWVDWLLLRVDLKERPFLILIWRLYKRVLHNTRELWRRLNLLRILNKLLPLFKQNLILIGNPRRDIPNVPHNLFTIASQFNGCVKWLGHRRFRLLVDDFSRPLDNRLEYFSVVLYSKTAHIFVFHVNWSVVFDQTPRWRHHKLSLFRLVSFAYWRLIFELRVQSLVDLVCLCDFTDYAVLRFLRGFNRTRFGLLFLHEFLEKFAVLELVKVLATDRIRWVIVSLLMLFEDDRVSRLLNRLWLKLFTVSCHRKTILKLVIIFLKILIVTRVSLRAESWLQWVVMTFLCVLKVASSAWWVGVHY